MITHKGRLLVAVSKLRDPNFFRSVTLLVEHGKAGAMGLILNRPTQTTVREAWMQAVKTECTIEGCIHHGGPCQSILTALHADPELSDIEVISGLHFTQEPAKLERLVALARQPIRFYVGFAGWGEGQLEGELKQGAWLTIDATSNDVFGDPQGLWDTTSRKITRQDLQARLGTKHIPPDPSVN